jgi:DNA polymerase III subunit beta
MSGNVLAVRFDPAVLARELAAVTAAVERKTTIPVLANVLIQSGKCEGLALTATDLELRIETRIPAIVETAGTATIPARRLLDYIRLLPAGDVDLSIGRTWWASLKAGRAKTRIAGISPDWFPDAPPCPGSVTQIPAAKLARMIRRTAFAISEEAARFNLAGAVLEVTDEFFRMTATDGHRLARVTVPGGGRAFRGIVPRRALMEVAKAAEGLALDAEVEVATDANDKWIHFEAGTRRISVQIQPGNIPDVDRVIPKSFYGSAILPVAETRAALARILSAARGSVSPAVTFEFGTKDTRIIGGTTGTVEAEEVLPVTVVDYLTLVLNGGYVQDVLAAMESEKVVLEYQTATAAVVFRPVAEYAADDYFVLVMPTRV